MSTLIKNLHIQNFKSVRDLSLECDRINIFIGRPNAGKSNILEAISLLGAGYSSTSRFMEDFIRYKTIAQLFSNFDINTPIGIIVDDTIAELRVATWRNNFKFSISSPPPHFELDIQLKNKWPFAIANIDIGLSKDGIENERGSKESNPWPSPVKKYEFKPLGDYKEKDLFLHPPHGDNFYLIVRSHQELREEIQHFLKPNGLELLLDEEAKRISVVQRQADSLLSFPLHLVPDTFQRYIFHLAAIMSNRDSVLLFEEPESHSYAPYVYQLAQHILNDEGGNQYFITTHSPYFLLPLMQEGKDVAVFATWFEDYQTHARRLSEEEIRELLDFGVDVFLNLDHFTPA